MPPSVQDSYLAIGIAIVICTIPALLTAVYRLYIRRSRYWTDDLLAFLSALSLLLMVASTLAQILFSSNISGVIHVRKVAAYYLAASFFYSALWLARLSMLFSIIRVHPEYGFEFGFRLGTRKALYIISGVFIVTPMLLVCQLFWVCEPGNATTRWKEMENPKCNLTKQVAILQVAADSVSDSVLVFIPIRLIQTISSHSLRRRLAWIFSTGFITTAVSIPHATFILVGMGMEEIIAAYVEVCAGLIVCNIPVVISRLITSRAENTENSLTECVPNSAILHEMTTVGDTAVTSWLTWNRDLLGEYPGSLRSGNSRPVTIDLGHLPDEEEVMRRWRRRYPPLATSKHPTSTWS
ncbi:hypothetical protein PM082_015010 [Marasmius tenuissimus]|nr:hypothetical protein PM082_015010 [Marasmius tenuissimus]